MAITLDELLGRNTQTVSRQSVEAFPSYEEFNASRQQGYSAPQPVQSAVRYNFDSVPAREVRSAESVRDYEATRPYVAPQNSEYQTRDYAFYENLRANREQARPQAYEQNYMASAQNVYSAPIAQPVQYVEPQQMTYAQPQVAPQHQNFYDFSAQDSERLSEEVLFDKLAHTTSMNTPVFDDASAMQAKRPSVFARKAQKTQNVNEEKQRARLNTKGKVILGVYLAVIAVVASLIIVNATKINQGKALAPTSSIEIVAEDIK